MNAEFYKALDLLEKERHIPADFILSKLASAIEAAFKKEYSMATPCIEVVTDVEKKDIKVYFVKDIVENVENPETQICLADAKAVNRRAKLGEKLRSEVNPKDFRRLSANAAKNVLIQAIREAEREAQQRAYDNCNGSLITVTVNKVDPENGNVVVDTDNGRAVLKREEQIPGEYFEVGDKILVFVADVNHESKGSVVTLSRKVPGFIRRLFEVDIPEIQDGTVIIKNVAREAGSRTKIAVYSREADVDAIGACIGPRGARIDAILNELQGEKVDIVPYYEEIESFIAAALSPAEIIDVMMGEDNKSATVIVNSDQLSLAIGKEGQNARLAARLTGCKIDIKPEGYAVED